MKALGFGSQLFQIPKPLGGCERAIGPKKEFVFIMIQKYNISICRLLSN
jgi:hypothetical protein